MTVLLGAKWESAIDPLRIIALVMPLTIVVPVVSTVVQSLRRGDVIVRNVATSAILMPAAFALGSQWGIVGLSVAWLAAFPVVFAINMRRAMRLMHLRMAGLLIAMSRSAASAGMMYAVVAGTRFSFDVDGVWRLALLIGVGAVTHLSAAAVANRDDCRLLLAASEDDNRSGKGARAGATA